MYPQRRLSDLCNSRDRRIWVGVTYPSAGFTNAVPIVSYYTNVSPWLWPLLLVSLTFRSSAMLFYERPASETTVQNVWPCRAKQSEQS